MTADPIRFALLGHGAFGSAHARAIQAVEGVQLVAVAEGNPERYEKATEALKDIPVYSDYRELLDEVDCDVVDIVLPNHLHHDAASRALKADRHVLLEKPMTHTVRECLELEKIAKDRARLLHIGHEFRLSSLWGRVRQCIDEGLVGDPLYVLVELSRHPYLQGCDGWRYDIDRVGNWILEEPIHFFDLARWYLESAGEPESVFALASSRQAGHPELQDNLSALIRHENGAYAIVTQTLSAFEHHQTVKVTGTKGAIWASWGGTMGRSLDPEFMMKTYDGNEIREVKIEKMPGELYELRTQIERMAEGARGAEVELATGADGRWAVALCQAADLSAKERREVPVSELAGI